jgi:hypothetical protein
MPNERCRSCGRSFKGVRTHFSRNRECARACFAANNSNSAHPPIPTAVNTLPSPLRTTAEAEIPDSSYQNRLRQRQQVLNYSESARRVAPRLGEDDGFPTLDDDCGDYISTFFDNDQQEDAPSPASTRLPPDHEAHHQDMLELAVDSWTSQYDSRDAEYNSVAAVAGLPANAAPAAVNDLQAAQPPITPANHHMGYVQAVTVEEQNSRIVASPQDRSMARIYRLLDDAGSPRYLGDAIIR